MSEKFLKSERILTSRDFKLTLNQGRKVVAKNFVLFNRRSECDHRMGLIVSKKVGNAVARNRVKRVVREWYRKTDKPSGELVVLARAEASNRTTEELTSELNDLGNKLRP